MNWISLADGPADRVTLELRRAPKLLRIVLAADGKWDALDQLDDAPQSDEQIFVYVRGVVPESYGMIDYRGKRGREGGRFVAWRYRSLNEPSPDESTLRDTALWRAWCQTNAARLCPGEAVPA